MITIEHYSEATRTRSQQLPEAGDLPHAEHQVHLPHVLFDQSHAWHDTYVPCIGRGTQPWWAPQQLLPLVQRLSFGVVSVMVGMPAYDALGERNDQRDVLHRYCEPSKCHLNGMHADTSLGPF